MSDWKQAQAEVLERLQEVKLRIHERDEGATLALINQQDAFCEEARLQQPEHSKRAHEAQCRYCEGYIQAGGCMGKLDAIDRAVLHGEWEEAGRLVDEYIAWVKSLDVA